MSLLKNCLKIDPNEEYLTKITKTYNQSKIYLSIALSFSPKFVKTFPNLKYIKPSGSIEIAFIWLNRIKKVYFTNSRHLCFIPNLLRQHLCLIKHMNLYHQFAKLYYWRLNLSMDIPPSSPTKFAVHIFIMVIVCVILSLRW